MFGKKAKKDAQQPKEESLGSVSVMPDVFYGGKDPNIYHTQLDAPKKKTAPKKDDALEQKKKEILGKKPVAAPQRTPPGVQKPALQKATGHIQQPKRIRHVAPQKEKRRWPLLIVLLIILLGGSATLAWYVFRPSPAQVPPTPVVTPDPIPQIPAVPTPPPIPEVPLLDEEPEEEPLLEPQEEDRLVVDAFLGVVVPDIDDDDLTDLEEELFATDSGGRDSDGDGYIDGLEVRNLYSPKGFAPTRIIDSGLVQEYVNPVWKYRLYYPVQWTVDAVDPQSRTVLLSTIQGDYIEVHTFEKQTGEGFISWFSRVVEGIEFRNLQQETNRFQIDGYIGSRNRLVSFYESDQFVFALVYRAEQGGAVAYPHIKEMVFQSFRPTDIFIEIPEQIVLPEPPVFAEDDIAAETNDGQSLDDVVPQDDGEAVTSTPTQPVIPEPQIVDPPAQNEEEPISFF